MKRVPLTDEELFAAGKYCEQPEIDFGKKLKAASARLLSSLTDREREVLAARVKKVVR